LLNRVLRLPDLRGAHERQSDLLNEAVYSEAFLTANFIRRGLCPNVATNTEQIGKMGYK
jgi:hypothetical protein